MGLVDDTEAPTTVRPDTWTWECHLAATDEGWDLFDSEGSSSGPLQVQAFDDPDVGGVDLGGEDTNAWMLVKAQTGEHHRIALAILKDVNPLEYERIVQWPTVVCGHWNYDTDTVVWGVDE